MMDKYCPHCRPIVFFNFLNLQLPLSRTMDLKPRVQSRRSPQKQIRGRLIQIRLFRYRSLSIVCLFSASHSVLSVRPQNDSFLLSIHHLRRPLARRQSSAESICLTFSTSKTPKLLNSLSITPPDVYGHKIQQLDIPAKSTLCLKKLCQLLFCSSSVKYEPISTKIAKVVPE